jgi:hypothetical protein
MPTPNQTTGSPLIPVIAEVRYSLPQLLAELELERASGSFAMEKLDQKEIGNLFKARRPSRRAKPRK